MRYLIYFLVVLLMPGMVLAQKPDYPRDTSYNIQSAYEHIAKNWRMSPVEKQEFDGINEQTDISYSNPGRTLKLDIYYSDEKNRQPAVLLVYGGGWSSGEKENQGPMAQQLALQGFVAVVPEYRLSPEAQYPAAVNDLKNALRWMRENADAYGIDPSRIAVLGCSAGAQLATLLGTTGHLKLFEADGDELSTAVQAIINIDGIVSFIHPEAEEGTYAAKWLGGSKAELPDIWKEASPLEYAGKATPPILFINSSHARFHAGRDDMIEILDREGIYSEVETIDGSPHSFWLVNPWFEPTVDYTVAFLDRIFKQNK